MIQEAKGSMEIIKAQAIGLLVGMTFFFSSIIFYDTMFNKSPKFSILPKMSEEYINDHGDSIIFFRETIESDRDRFIRISRFLVKDPDNIPQYILSNSIRPINFGKNEIEVLFTLSPRLSAGKWCVISVYSWRPRFSLLEQHYASDPSCFLVEKR